MRIKRYMTVALFCLWILVGCQTNDSQDASTNHQVPFSFDDLEVPSFTNTSVHDPSVIKVEDLYYVFGSHLAAAKSSDLMNWELIASGVKNGNPLIPNVEQEMQEALTWSETDTFWAPDVIQLGDGRFYMYYNTCRGDSPLSSLGIAVADDVEGPYEDLGIILKSGMWGKPSEDGRVYDATYHPNVVDPDVFFDKEGRLWMMYGSYSGGIFIMEMNPETGFPLPDQGYGKKILGGNHSRIEGPYILYSPESDYYYMFLSFGGLDSDGGYNIRVARSKTPDGPYLDPSGQDMIKCKGKNGTFFDDRAIEPYGGKLMGNFQFNTVTGEPGKKITTGYVSPGHNSAYYNEEKNEYYLIFHSRFTMKGEQHEIRVHQMYLNEDDWFVVNPHRYAGESLGSYDDIDLIGDFKYINHGKDITADIKVSDVITLNQDGTISGAAKGTWTLKGEHDIVIMIDDIKYIGVVTHAWNEERQCYVMTFSAMSDNGVSIWGSKVVLE